MFQHIDPEQLAAVTGGVLPGPNGEGCTEQGGPRLPFPSPRPPIGGPGGEGGGLPPLV